MPPLRMFQQLIVFYTFIATLNSAIRLNEAVGLNRSNRFINASKITTTEAENVWQQPIMQSQYASPTPTSLTTALTAANKSLAGSYSKNKLSKWWKARHNFALNTTRHNATAKLPTESESESDMQPASQLFNRTFNKQDYANANANAGENEKHKFNSYQRQLLSNYNVPQIQYPEIQIPKIVVQCEQRHVKQPAQSHQVVNANSQILSRFSHLNYSTDMIKHSELRNPTFSLLSVWHNMAQAKQITMLGTGTDTGTGTSTDTGTKNTSNPMNFPQRIGAKDKNNMENMLPTTLHGLLTATSKEDLIDNIAKRQHQNHHTHNKPDTNNDFKAKEIDDNEAVKGTKSVTAEGSYNSKEKFLENRLNNFERIAKHNDNDDDDDDNEDNDNEHKIPSKPHYKITGHNEVGKQNVSEGFLNRNEAYDDIDLEIFTPTAQQLLKATTTTLTAALAASLKKLQELYKVKKKFALTSTTVAAAAAAASFPSAWQGANETVDETNSAEFQTTLSGPERTTQIQNLPSFARTPTFFSPITPRSKSSIAVSTDRKFKKVKKKVQKILLPLLLAYKLKFLALLPLLAGGLILLVGSTGLAGFFFALFMAVMSLHSSQGGAVVVKKYL